MGSVRVSTVLPFPISPGSMPPHHPRRGHTAEPRCHLSFEGGHKYWACNYENKMMLTAMSPEAMVTASLERLFPTPFHGYCGYFMWKTTPFMVRCGFVSAIHNCSPCVLTTLGTHLNILILYVLQTRHKDHNDTTYCTCWFVSPSISLTLSNILSQYNCE